MRASGREKARLYEREKEERKAEREKERAGLLQSVAGESSQAMEQWEERGMGDNGSTYMEEEGE